MSASRRHFSWLKPPRLSQLVLLCLTLSACDTGPPPEQAAASHLLSWFQSAHRGDRDESLCHGLGLLKHSTYSCADYLQSAASISLESRSVTDVTPMDCYQDVCGSFYQLEVLGRDHDGNESRELVLLKQDEGVMRVYWYRSDAMLADIRRAQELQEEADKDPIQAAYDELTNTYPALYTYPPCLELRPSSQTLLAPPVALEELDPEEFDQLATLCASEMCIGTVGRKFAALCKPQ